jgi:hypothetical protein
MASQSPLSSKYWRVDKLRSLAYARTTIEEPDPKKLRHQMNTFLPYADYEQTAQCLRSRDLETQILHVRLLLDTLHEVDELTVQAWQNHPIVSMWRGHEAQLATYGLAMSEEWNNRTGNDPESEYFQWHLDNVSCVDDFEMSKPKWMEDKRMEVVMSNHRGILLFKDAAWYSKFGWNVGPCSSYFWPVADA